MLLMTERERYGGTVPQPYPERRTVNIVQACELAGVSRRALYYWMEAGTLEYARLPSGRRRIYVDTLLRRDPKD